MNVHLPCVISRNMNILIAILKLNIFTNYTDINFYNNNKLSLIYI